MIFFNMISLTNMAVIGIFKADIPGIASFQASNW